MAISLRTVLFIAVIIFSLLTYSIYLYSKSNYTLPALFNVKVPLSNGTQIQTNAKDGSPAGANAGQAQETSNHGFIDAFIASISMIVVSELGDKTFFIAAIMAMRHARLVVYAGAMSALAAMTILSAMLGHVVTKFIPRIYTYYLSSILFAWFGLKMLKDGYAMSPNEGAEEYEEAQQEVEKAEANDDLEAGGGGGQLNDGSAKETQQRRVPTRSIGATITAWIRRYISPIFVQALIMTFLAVGGEQREPVRSHRFRFRA